MTRWCSPHFCFHHLKITNTILDISCEGKYTAEHVPEISGSSVFFCGTERLFHSSTATTGPQTLGYRYNCPLTGALPSTDINKATAGVWKARCWRVAGAAGLPQGLPVLLQLGLNKTHWAPGLRSACLRPTCTIWTGTLEGWALLFLHRAPATDCFCFCSAFGGGQIYRQVSLVPVVVN